MGLDMYLTAKRYLSQYDEGEKAIADSIGKLDIGADGMRVKEVSCEAMYWRKANAIHHWFVQNVQDGEDNCQESWVDRAQLEQLLEACSAVMDNHKLAAELLPPCEGFFFGSQQLDEFYFADIAETEAVLEKLLKMPEYKKWDFYYRASW